MAWNIETIPLNIAASTYDPRRDVIWVATYNDGRIYQTKDGRQFELITTLPEPPFMVLRIFISTNGAVFLGALWPDGIYRSDDGISFHRIDGVGGLPSCRSTWALCETENGALFLGLYTAGLSEGIFMSTDRGRHWTNVFDPRSFWKGQYDFFHIQGLFYDHETAYIYATYGDGPPEVNGPEGIIRSEDNGDTWKIIHDTCKKWRYTTIFRFGDYIYIFDDSTKTRSMKPRPAVVERFQDGGDDTVTVELVCRPSNNIGSVVHPGGATILHDMILYGTLFSKVSPGKAQILCSKDGTNWELIHETPYTEPVSGYYGFEHLTQGLDQQPNGFLLVGIRGEDYGLRIEPR